MFLVKDHYFNSFDEKAIYVKEKSPVHERSTRVVACLPACCQTHHFFDCPVSDYSLMGYLAKKGFRVFAYDRRGFGASYHPPEGRSITYGVDLKDVEALVDFITLKTGVKSISIVAFGFGALVACLHAINHPDKVEALVLMDFIWKFQQPIPPQVKETLLNQPDGYLKHSDMAGLFNGALVPFASPEVVQWFHSTFTEAPVGPLLTVFEPMPLIKSVEKIKASVLIIRGTRAEVTSETDSIEFLDNISSQIRAIDVLEGAGAGPHLEKTHYQTVLRDIAWFLSR